MRDLIGIPFLDRGRDRLGMDCWGLAMAAMARFGKNVPDFDVSCFDTQSINGIYEEEWRRWLWQRVDAPEPGDAVTMRLDPTLPDQVQHVGVYIGGGRILHTLNKRASHIVRIDDPYWSRKISGYFRWIG